MPGVEVARRLGARALWTVAAVVGIWGLVVSAAQGFRAFDERIAADMTSQVARVAQWDCVGDTAARLAAPDDVLVLRTADESFVRPRVIESVYPRVRLTAANGTGTLVVDLASSGAPGERCGELVVRIER